MGSAVVGEAKLLIESIDAQPVLLEQEEGQRRRFKAVFQKADVINENGRIYPRRVLEKAIEEFKELIKEGRAVGTLEHPADGKTRVSDISHKIVDIYMEEDGTVVGVAECLNTSAGRELQALLEAGVKVGISSRGVGSVKVVERNGRKVEEVQDDYRIEAFDIVYEPSTPGAFITEGKEEGGKYVLVEKEKIQNLIETVIKEAIKAERRRARERIRKLKEQYENSLDYKYAVAVKAIAEIVSPLISEEAREFLEEVKEFREKEKAYKEKIEELELELYKREIAERHAVPLEALSEAKTKEEVNKIVEEFRVKRKRKDLVEARGHEGGNPWTKKLSNIFITGGIGHGS